MGAEQTSWKSHDRVQRTTSLSLAAHRGGSFHGFATRLPWWVGQVGETCTGLDARSRVEGGRTSSRRSELGAGGSAVCAARTFSVVAFAFWAAAAFLVGEFAFWAAAAAAFLVGIFAFWAATAFIVGAFVFWIAETFPRGALVF
jgi:hypothetical protein